MTERIQQLKKEAAVKAVDQIASHMVVGLGSGSTAKLMIDEVGQRLRSGALKDIIAIPTSESTAQQAQALSIPLATLAEQPRIDLTIDGADEIDPQLDLIKGLGGSLLREKIVAVSSARLVIIADERKIVDRLGSRAPLPVEVIRFAEQPVSNFLRGLGASPVVRQRDGSPFITDEGNIILDCHFAEMPDPYQLASLIHARPGVVEHGLFLNMVSEAIVATESGVKHLKRS